MIYREEGVVLRTYRLGESDRIVVVMGNQRGKLRTVAKGVRKTRSRFGSRLEPMSHVALQLYEGRTFDTITQAEVLDHFRPVREDLDRMAKATSLLEAVDVVAQEREPNPRLYQMLVGALRSLSSSDSPLLVAAFFLKLLAIEGFHPVLDRCVSCRASGDTATLAGFDADSGGALCRACCRGPGVIPMSPPALVLMRNVLEGGLAEALKQIPGPAVREVTSLATVSLEHHLERRLRSLPVAAKVSSD